MHFDGAVSLSNPPSNVKEKTPQQRSPLSIYQEEFETKLLQSTAQYYSRESTLYLSQHDVASYMRKVCGVQLVNNWRGALQIKLYP